MTPAETAAFLRHKQPRAWEWVEDALADARGQELLTRLALAALTGYCEDLRHAEIMLTARLRDRLPHVCHNAATELLRDSPEFAEEVQIIRMDRRLLEDEITGRKKMDELDAAAERNALADALELETMGVRHG